jgi:hypothetical protein
MRSETLLVTPLADHLAERAGDRQGHDREAEASGRFASFASILADLPVTVGEQNRTFFRGANVSPNRGKATL